MAANRILLATREGLRTLEGPTIALAGRRVTALATAGQGWLAALEHHHVTDDTGRIAAEIPDAAVTCVTPYRDGALLGTEGADLVRVRGQRVDEVPGFADVEHRNAWYTPWGGPPATRSASVAADGTMYVNVHVGGILRSRDDGRTWEQTVDIDVDVHQVVTAPGVVLAACGVGGLAVSRDGGDTWRMDTSGLHATYCRAVAVAGDTVLLSAALGPRGGRAALYRRRLHADGGFARCTAGLSAWFDANIDTHHLAAAGELAAFAAADGRVYVSRDAGASWEEADPVDGIAAVAVTGSPA